MTDEPKRAAGQEVLVLDGDKNILKGLEKLLGDAGLTVTLLTDPLRARDQVEQRFIPIVLCDLDTPHQGGGVDFLRFVRERSPLTLVLIMSPRKTFDAVAPAFRAGAHDVILKTQDSVPYLRDRVVEVATSSSAAINREQLLVDMAELHEEFLKRMMDMSRQVTDLEDKILSREGETSSSAATLTTINLILVDDEPGLNAVVEQSLPADKGWRIRYAQSGGEALDAASQNPPHILVVKELLPDLPSSMVIKSIKASAPDVVALVFTPPLEGAAGEVKMIEASRLHVLIPSFATPDQLVSALQEVKEALRTKVRDRRYIQNFKKHQFDFLKKYSQMKQRLAGKGPEKPPAAE